MSEWGPWVTDSDPKVGMYVQVRVENDYSHEYRIYEGIVESDDGNYLSMSPPVDCGEDWTLIEWRERKPKGLTILESILNDLTAPTKPTVPA